MILSERSGFTEPLFRFGPILKYGGIESGPSLLIGHLLVTKTAHFHLDLSVENRSFWNIRIWVHLLNPSKVYSITFKELDAYTLFHGYYLDVRYVNKNGLI